MRRSDEFSDVATWTLRLRECAQSECALSSSQSPPSVSTLPTRRAGTSAGLTGSSATTPARAHNETPPPPQCHVVSRPSSSTSSTHLESPDLLSLHPFPASIVQPDPAHTVMPLTSSLTDTSRLSSAMSLLPLLLLLLSLVCSPIPCDSQAVPGWENPTYATFRGHPYTVSYDSRSFLLNNTRILLFAGSHHYFRSTPQQWPLLFQQYRAAHLNALQMIIFWSYHEAERGRFDFTTDSRDVVRFIQAAADAGLFIYLRLGPYICAEYSWGGMPYWLRVNGTKVRTTDPRWTSEANRWLDHITAIIEPFLARNGGPIIVYQLENEYGNVEPEYGQEGKRFLQWNVDKAIELDLGVPLAMCSQMDAPQNVLSTYNGWYADGQQYPPPPPAHSTPSAPTHIPHPMLSPLSPTLPPCCMCSPPSPSPPPPPLQHPPFHPVDWIPTFRAAYPNQPPMWTEHWQGWMQTWGEATPTRPSEDVAFASLRWFIRGGAYVSYYPFMSGTTFGRQTGNVDLITDYAFDAPVDAHGTPHPRKYPHLQRLHEVLLRYLNLIIHAPPSQDTILPNDLRLNEYNSSSGRGGVAFLTNANSGAGKDFNVTWRGRQWPVAAWSTQVVDVDSMTVVYDTSRVTAPSPPSRRRKQEGRRWREAAATAQAGDVGWAVDAVGVWEGGAGLTADHPLEQLTLTFDQTDYLWYVTNITLSEADIGRGVVTLHMTQAMEYVYYYIDGALLNQSAHVAAADVTLPLPPSLTAGAHQLQLLNAVNGVDDYGAFLETVSKGLMGSITMGQVNLTSQQWRHQVGLRGEAEQWYAQGGGGGGGGGVEWNVDVKAGLQRSLVWWRWNLTTPTPHGDAPPTWQLDVRGLGKGEMWVNGRSIGRFYNITSDLSSCTPCDVHSYYTGPAQCRMGCGQHSQPYLHVPPAFLHPPAGPPNVVVAFAERPIDPTSLRLQQRN